MTLSPDQLEIRKQGITATDIAAIVGAHPWRSPLDVWLEKTGQRDSFEGNVRTKWGNLLEPVIREDYAERHGCRVEVPGTLEDPLHPWRKATPDGIVYPGGGLEADRGLEIKVHGRDAILSGSLRYGEPGTDDVPHHELIQCTWGMAVTGLPRWDLVPFTDGIPVEYIIDRDEELIGLLSERAERFLIDNVQGGKPPEPDGTESYEKWLAARWKKHNENMLNVSGDASAGADLARLREAVIAAKRAEANLEHAQQRIKVRIGESSGLEWRDGKSTRKVTWRFNRDGCATDLAAMITHLKNAAGLIASAKAPALDALEIHLRKLGGGYVGNEPISGIELSNCVRELRAALNEIATTKEEQFSKVTPGARVLRVPPSWHSEAKS